MDRLTERPGKYKFESERIWGHKEVAPEDFSLGGKVSLIAFYAVICYNYPNIMDCGFCSLIRSLAL